MERQIITDTTNQLIQAGMSADHGVNPADIFSGISYSNGEYSYVSNNPYSRFGLKSQDFYAGHKYFWSFKAKCTSGTGVALIYNGTKWVNSTPLTSSYQTLSIIWNVATSFTMTNNDYPFWASIEDLEEWYTSTIVVKDFMLCDLTAVYGPGNEPSTVEQFLTDHPEFNDYVPYSTLTYHNYVVMEPTEKKPYAIKNVITI